MADRVDAAVQLPQRSTPKPSLDTGVPIAKVAELRPAHHPVLALRQRDDCLIRPDLHGLILRFQHIDRLMQDSTEVTP
jgi:hypothetical protein